MPWFRPSEAELNARPARVAAVCGRVHFCAGMGIIAVRKGAKQILSADFHCLFGKRPGKIVVFRAYIRLYRMGENIHTGICRDTCRNAFDKNRVQNCLVGSHVLGIQRDFYLLFRVGDDGKGGYFTSGSAGGGPLVVGMQIRRMWGL